MTTFVPHDHLQQDGHSAVAEWVSRLRAAAMLPVVLTIAMLRPDLLDDEFE